MGVPLTPIVVKETQSLADLAGKRLAVDGHGDLYQFLALIRRPGGLPLSDSRGRITSHLVGLFYRTTRLMSEAGLQLVFVFDGQPPSLKADEIARRRAIKARFEVEAEEARQAGDLARAYSKSTMTSRVTREMREEAGELLRLLGIPVIQAPGEGEAQAAYMAQRGLVWAAASKDYDSLLFGTPRLVRFLGVGGKEFLPSKGVSRPVPPELVTAETLLASLGITREQLVDVAILMGTDFNAGVPGIGPKKALRLVQECGSIEGMPPAIQEQVPTFREVRAIYLDPVVSEPGEIRFGEPDEAGLVRFLCEEREFSRERVLGALARVREAKDRGLLP